MLRPKKKITRKELKQDALITTYAKLTGLYETHKKTLRYSITAVVIVVLVVVFYINNQKANIEKASADLGKVYQYFDNGQYQVAIDGVPERNIPGLKAIVENYGGSTAGELARFYLANSYYQIGKYDEALEEFEAFSPTVELLVISRLSGIAACYEAKGEYARAAEFFEQAVGVNTNDVNAAENLNSAARNFALAGESERALDLYRKLKKNYPTTSYGREAGRFITQLSV